ncbi:uncharacterized protein B0H64DRAFT_451719 [Chaetomium fimeti]|uniref:Rhodopsin domain-containing protein n=1 Tax=Chaetomium fimeti TaxID=1854472 RepID=A0AAE0LMW0_9PEZI|nr:hypothetical protein B0H64DRAFT_451719 [Chaetomium fimeti]
MDRSQVSPGANDAQERGIGHIVDGVTWPFTALAILMVGLRFYVRKRFNNAWLSDDWIMALAVVFNTIYQAFLTTSVWYGYGKPRVTMTPDAMASAFFYQHACITWAQLADVLARISISILLIRIFGVARPWFKWLLISFTTLQAIVSTISVVLSWTEKWPVESIWDFRIVGRQRIDFRVQQYTSLVSQFVIAITDLTFVLFPVIFITSLCMPLHRKLGIIALMAATLVATAAAVTKIAIVLLVMEGKIGLTTGHGASIYITSGIEQSLVIIMGCIPALGPMKKLQLHLKFSRLGQSIVSLLSGGSSRSASSTKSKGSGLPEKDLGLGRTSSNYNNPANATWPNHDTTAEQNESFNAAGSLEASHPETRSGKGIVQTSSFAVIYQQDNNGSLSQ